VEQVCLTYVIGNEATDMGGSSKENVMVTIYTERGPAGEVLMEKQRFNFGRMAAISLGAALLFSLVGAFNLSNDVKNVTAQKVPYIQQRVAELPAARLY
jgi:hypothetical protein